MKKTISIITAIAMVFSILAITPSALNDSVTNMPEIDKNALAAGEVAASKQVVDNGDGTFNITLSAFGKTFDEEKKDQEDISVGYDVIFVLDYSGSMNAGNRLRDLRTSANNAIATLLSQNRHRVAVVTYGNTATRLTGSNNANPWIAASTYTLPNSSVSDNERTNIMDGMMMANEFLSRRSGESMSRPAYIILMTDGQPNNYYNTYSLDNYTKGTLQSVNTSNANGSDLSVARTIKLISDVKNKWGNNLDIYTLGFALNSFSGVQRAYAEAVINPAHLTNTSSTYFNNLAGVRSELGIYSWSATQSVQVQHRAFQQAQNWQNNGSVFRPDRAWTNTGSRTERSSNVGTPTVTTIFQQARPTAGTTNGSWATLSGVTSNYFYYTTVANRTADNNNFGINANRHATNTNHTSTSANVTISGVSGNRNFRYENYVGSSGTTRGLQFRNVTTISNIQEVAFTFTNPIKGSWNADNAQGLGEAFKEITDNITIDQIVLNNTVTIIDEIGAAFEIVGNLPEGVDRTANGVSWVIAGFSAGQDYSKTFTIKLKDDVSDFEGTTVFTNGANWDDGANFATFQPVENNPKYTDKQAVSILLTSTGTVEIPIPTKYFTVTYHANADGADVDGVPEKSTGIEEGTEYNVSGVVPVRDGYEFKGWATTGTGTEAVKQFLIDGDKDLYAIWEVEPPPPVFYTVTYYANADGVTGVPAPSTDLAYEFDYDVSEAVPVKDGYEFKGWALEDGTIVTKLLIVDDVELYAQWEAEPPPPPVLYTVTYHANADDVTGVPAVSAGIEEGTDYSVSEEVPVKDGYKFNGWAETSTGTIAVTNLLIDDNKHLYAIWDEIVTPSIPIPIPTVDDDENEDEDEDEDEEDPTPTPTDNDTTTTTDGGGIVVTGGIVPRDVIIFNDPEPVVIPDIPTPRDVIDFGDNDPAPVEIEGTPTPLDVINFDGNPSTSACGVIGVIGLTGAAAAGTAFLTRKRRTEVED